MPNGRFPEVIKLANLNGQNGFKLDGENNNDQSGWSVSAAGDVNNDGHADLLIGAQYHNNFAGRSYVMFGGPEVGSSGLLFLANLNGTNGFKIDGEVSGEISGNVVRPAGDINTDGYADLFIGAPYYNARTGRSYIVFGGPEVGNSGLLSLTNLNGANGFKIDGEAANDDNGASADSGDVNGDGYSDLLIGALYHNNNAGRSYVVFGGPGVGSSGLLSLSSLNGVNGFKIDGETVSDRSGYRLSVVGDTNGDGYNDFIIGAVGHNSNTGRSYVVFGDSNIGNNGLLLLSTLNGANGFKLDGENNGDECGSFGRMDGDINGDGYSDLIIGAIGFSGGSDQGQTYVVFGGPGVGSSGSIALGNLNGTNGFKLDGENNGDRSGYPAAGDFNGDGYTDLFITAHGHNGQTGRSYVILGGSDVGKNGLSSLSSLDGANGFALDGESVNDGANGISIANGGDINSDGVIDLLIGANQHNNAVGRTYVIFGDIPPVLVNNSLKIYAGGVVRLTTDDLAAYDRNHDNNTLLFFPTNLSHGQFEVLSIPGIALSYFTRQQLLSGEIQFVHDQSAEPPSYNITVRSTGLAWTGPYSANITFNLLRMLTNQLTINQGQSVIINSENFNASDTGQPAFSLQFIITDLQHGRFELVAKPGLSIMTFSQQAVEGDQVRFVHDDTVNPPAYQVSVSNDIMITTPQAAVVDFNARPILVNNKLTINQNQMLILTSEQLLATHNGVVDSTLLFNITDLTRATIWVQSVSMQNVEVSFTQQALLAGQVAIIQDGSTFAPSYAVSVSDGLLQTQPAQCTVTFYKKPEITTNQLFLQLGKATIVTTDNLCAEDCTQAGSDDLVFTILNTPDYGQFAFVSNPSEPIVSFSQKQVKQSLIQFKPNSSSIAPRYQLWATDPVSELNSDLSVGSTLLLLENNWLINQGETFTLSANSLNATSSSNGSIVYVPIADILTHGYFALAVSPEYKLPSFQQSQVMRHEVVFVPDGTASAPTIVLVITDGTGGVRGAFTCPIDFAVFPRLEHAFLKINPPDRILLTSTNLQASDTNVPAGELVFQMSEVENDHFAYSWDWNTPITNFTQQSVQNGQVYFVTRSTLVPSFKVSVWNGRMHCQNCPQIAEIIAPDPESPGSQVSTLWSLWALLSPLLLPVLQWGIGKGYTHYFSRKEDEDIHKELIQAIMDQFWIGICGLTRASFEEHKQALFPIIKRIKDIQIDEKEGKPPATVTSDEKELKYEIKQEPTAISLIGTAGKPLHIIWNDWDPKRKKAVSLQIAQVVKNHLVRDQSNVSRFFKSLCISELTQSEIDAKTEDAIVNDAKKAIQNILDQKVNMMASSNTPPLRSSWCPQFFCQSSGSDEKDPVDIKTISRENVWYVNPFPDTAAATAEGNGYRQMDGTGTYF
jgi:Cadherin-like/FG-GAP repeat